MREKYHLLSCASCRNCEKRYNKHSDYSKYPVLPEHNYHGYDKGYGVREYTCECIGDYLLNSGNITCHTGNYIALIVRRKESLRHFLQMRIHFVAHIIGYMLSYPCVHVAFQYAYQICCKSYSERHSYEEYKLIEAS